MSKTLVFVDSKKIIGLAVPIIGSQIHISKNVTCSGGFSWVLQGAVTKNTQESVVVSLKDMLPEDIARRLVKKFPEEFSFSDLDEFTRKITTMDDVVGLPLKISGVLSIPGANVTSSFDPYNPPDLSCVRQFSYGGENCFVSTLTSDGICFPVYFSADSLSRVIYCNNKQVDIVGTLGFSSWYDVGKGRNINTVLTGIVLWTK